MNCVFACAGEEALPGMDALASLTSLELWGCNGLRALPTALWRLTQLRCLTHCLRYEARGYQSGTFPQVRWPARPP